MCEAPHTTVESGPSPVSSSPDGWSPLKVTIKTELVHGKSFTRTLASNFDRNFFDISFEKKLKNEQVKLRNICSEDPKSSINKARSFFVSPYRALVPIPPKIKSTTLSQTGLNFNRGQATTAETRVRALARVRGSPAQWNSSAATRPRSPPAGQTNTTTRRLKTKVNVNVTGSERRRRRLLRFQAESK